MVYIQGLFIHNYKPIFILCRTILMYTSPFQGAMNINSIRNIYNDYMGILWSQNCALVFTKFRKQIWWISLFPILPSLEIVTHLSWHSAYRICLNISPGFYFFPGSGDPASKRDQISIYTISASTNNQKYKKWPN